MTDNELIRYIVDLRIMADKRLDETNLHDDDYGDMLNAISKAKYELFYSIKDRVNAKAWENEGIMAQVNNEIERERFRRAGM